MDNPQLVRRRGAARALILVLALASSAAARDPERRGPALEPSTAYAAYVLAEVAEALDFAKPVVIYRAPVEAARAVFLEGREAIVYNPTFLADVTDRAGTSWAAVSVIAHEVGHHYYGHSRDRLEELPEEVVRQRELDADYLSGYALARMGATLEDAEAAQQALFDERGTATHPGSRERLRAILTGWLDGSGGRPLAARPSERIARGGAPPPAAALDFAAPPAFPEGRW